MAYENNDLHVTNPYASNLRADPELRREATTGGGRFAGILVAVLVALGLIVGISMFTTNSSIDTAPAAITAPDAAPAGTSGAAPAESGAAVPAE